MKKLLFFFFSVLLFASCSNDDSNSSGGNSRKIKYEVTGNFTGSMSATHTTESGGGATTEFTTLPWEMLIEFDPSVPSAGLAVGGIGGVQGQTLTVKVYQDGILKSTTPGTTGSGGSIVISSPSIVF